MMKISKPAFLSRSGGLGYHLRALRYHALWSDYHESLFRWLNGLAVRKKLVLIGPSGGYSLRPEFLKKFESITAFEPDPVARFIFERRLKIKPHWMGAFDFENIEKSLEIYKGSTVLFCNILGQLQFILPESITAPKTESNTESEIESLIKRLSRYDFDGQLVSYHDRTSGAIRPVFRQGLTSSHPLKDSEYLKLFDPKGKGELRDHLTLGLFKNSAEYHYFSWQIYPGEYHVIESTEVNWS